MNITDNPPILTRFLIIPPGRASGEWRVPLYPATRFTAPDTDSQPVYPRTEAIYKPVGYTADGSSVVEYQGVEVFNAGSSRQVIEMIRDLVEFTEQIQQEMLDQISESGGQAGLRWHMEIQSHLSGIKKRLAEIGIWLPKGSVSRGPK